MEVEPSYDLRCHYDSKALIIPFKVFQKLIKAIYRPHLKDDLIEALSS